ncbi:flagellar basal body P-ring protein FlgI, partial [Enterobacter hormaechei]
AQSIADAINKLRGVGTALPLDARTVQLRVPLGKSEQVRFLADVQNLEVKRVIADAKVIINARTGSVVMNRDV